MPQPEDFTKMREDAAMLRELADRLEAMADEYGGEEEAEESEGTEVAAPSAKPKVKGDKVSKAYDIFKSL